MHDISGKCVVFGKRRWTKPSDILNQRLMEYNKSLLGIDRDTFILYDKKVDVSLIDMKCLGDSMTRVDDAFIFTQKIIIDYIIKLEDEIK